MTITKFVKKEFLLLLLLIIMLINPFFYGYRVAVLFVLVLFFQLERTLYLFDKNAVQLFIFSVLYYILEANRIDVAKSMLAFLPDLFIPSMLYLIGKGISLRYKSTDIRVFFLFVIMLSFSFVPIVSIIEQVLNDGFSGGRSLYLIWDKTALISATGLGAYFAINMATIALLNTKKSNSVQIKISLIVFILFILSLICVLRLGNRTQLIIAAISFLVYYLYNFNRISKFRRFIQAVIFLSIIGFIFYLIVIESEWVYFFEDRISAEDTASAGGRTERWSQSFEMMITKPWGWELSKFGYSHNLWLDVARVSGIVALIPLILFTYSSIKIYFQSLRILRKDAFLHTYVVVFFISIFLMFIVEPIMDGFYLLFLLYCLFIGFLKGITVKV